MTKKGIRREQLPKILGEKETLQKKIKPEIADTIEAIKAEITKNIDTTLLMGEYVGDFATGEYPDHVLLAPRRTVLDNTAWITVGAKYIPVEPNRPIERTYWHAENLDNGYNAKRPKLSTKEKANLVSSLTESARHAPVIDLDFPARLVPSSTPGHFHLYLDKEITWDQYRKLIQVLQEIGLIDKKWAETALESAMTFVRPPGIYKPNATPDVGDDPETLKKRIENLEHALAEAKAELARGIDEAHKERVVNNLTWQ